MESKLSLAIQGVKGGNIKEFPKLGFTCNFVGDNNKIVFDAFVGYGDSYKYVNKPKSELSRATKYCFGELSMNLQTFLKVSR